jgi:hypothetical protein
LSSILKFNRVHENQEKIIIHQRAATAAFNSLDPPVEIENKPSSKEQGDEQRYNKEF